MEKPKCDRCLRELTSFKWSWFNTDLLCLNCQEVEKKHPLFEKAKEIENAEVKKGNYNYPGIFSGKNWDEILKIKTIN